jgi:nitrogen fixation protein FixH
MNPQNENKKNVYPLMIVLLIGVFLVFSTWAALQAAGLGSRVTDADYYSKGLRYNTSQVEKRAAETLGWRLETRLDGQALEFRLTDRQGTLVDRAIGAIYLAVPGAAENVHLSAREFDAGRYRINLTDKIKGSVQARLEFERQGARLNRRLLLNL